MGVNEMFADTPPPPPVYILVVCSFSLQWGCEAWYIEGCIGWVSNVLLHDQLVSYKVAVFTHLFIYSTTILFMLPPRVLGWETALLMEP